MEKMILLVLLVWSGWGEAQILPKHCSLMSKDPRCWERPRLVCIEQAYTKCTKLESVKVIKEEHFCSDFSGVMFNCSELVGQYGERLYQLPLRVHVQTVDMCHVPGLCGPRACKEFVQVEVDFTCE